MTGNENTVIVSKAIELIEANYVIAEKKEEILKGLRKKMNEGRYSSMTSYDSLAEALTSDLIELSGDKHLYVRAISESSMDRPSMDAWLKQEREDEINYNFGFTEVKVLEGNIGYLKIREFMHPDHGIETAIAAMKFIENTTATVIDIRDNGGGYGGLAEYLISYFFGDEPLQLSTTFFAEKDGTTSLQTFTHPFVVGKRRLDHKLYIILNEHTVSAAEYFAYVLQANKKAIIVGETSAGAANRNTYFPLNDKLRISISTGSPIVHATGTNWEGVGVIPDIRCEPDQALAQALNHIQQQGAGLS